MPRGLAGLCVTLALAISAAARAQADTFREAMTVEGNVVRDTPADNRAPAALGTLALATVGMLLAALIAVSSFVVMAQRRLRQLGLLAAIGGTPKQVRLVTLVDGAIVEVETSGWPGADEFVAENLRTTPSRREATEYFESLA